MASNKRSARKRQQQAFETSLAGMDDLFDRERHHQQQVDARRDHARRHKACSSKRRYPNQAEARHAIVACESYGRTGLCAYRCPYCHGWHLTSHPRE